MEEERGESPDELSEEESHGESVDYTLPRSVREAIRRMISRDLIGREPRRDWRCGAYVVRDATEWQAILALYDEKHNATSSTVCSDMWVRHLILGEHKWEFNLIDMLDRQDLLPSALVPDKELPVSLEARMPSMRTSREWHAEAALSNLPNP